MLNNYIKSFRLIANNGNKVLSRSYAFKSDLKIKWKRPEHISCIKPDKSGDLKIFPKVDTTQIVLEFQDSKELQTADQNVKNLFNLEHNRRKYAVETVKKTMIDSVKRHDLDLGSMESKLAKMTVQIRAMQQYMEDFPRNKLVKVQLKEMIDKRKKFLKYLRKWDYKRFEWILEKLDIVYKPPPTEFRRITRKESLVKLTDIHCSNIKDERLLEYKAQLESQQLDFLTKKIQNLEFIRSEQEVCKIPVTITKEEIQFVKKHYKDLAKKRQEEEAVKKLQTEKDEYD